MRQLGNYQKYVSLILMIVVSFGAQVISLIKTSMLAGIFGATEAMDAFSFSNSVTSFIFAFVSGAVPTIIIPSYVKKHEGKQAIDGFITIVYAILFTIVILLISFRFAIISALTTRGERYTYLVCSLLVVLLFAQCINSWTYVTLAFFHSEGQYSIPKVINLISQVLVLIVLAAYKELTITQYAYIVASGVMLGAIIDICIAVKKGWRYRPELSWNNTETQNSLKAFLPILFSTGVYQLSLMTDTLLTERLEDGMITILAYASQISAIVNAVILGNLQTYIYPRIVRNIRDGKPQELFWKQSEALHCFTWLVIAGFVVIGREGISLLFEHGAFGSEAASAVYIGSSIYIFGQQFNMVRDMVYKYFYAEGDTKTPAMNSILVSISNIIISLILIKQIGFYGVVLGTICASFISLVVIMFRFSQKYGFEKKVSEIIWPYVKNCIVGMTSIVVMMQLKVLFGIDSDLVAIIAYGAGTVLIYLLVQGIINSRIIDAIRAL